MKSIEELIKEYQNLQELKLKRREVWTEEKKGLIESTLNSVIKKIKYDWYLDKHESKQNQEAIYIAFGNKPSGIFDRESNKHLMHYGGALFFTQSVTGKIIVWIQLPYIEELLYHESGHKILTRIEPSELNEKVILDYVELFLKEMINSEKQEREFIDFKK